MNDQPTLIIYLFALAIGVAATLVSWLISRALASVPEEDRAYKDPPPLGFRLLWWPIQWVGHCIEPLLSAAYRTGCLARLQQAGLDYSLAPKQFAASRLICGACAAAVCTALMEGFSRPGESHGQVDLSTYLQVGGAGFLLGYAYPALWLKDRLKARRSELLKSLPFFLDIITLCVEAGLNLQGAISQSVAKGPKGVMRDELQRVLRDIRAGKPRAESLRAMADRLQVPAVSSFCTAVIQAERMGMNLGPVLRAQADQRRSERFLRAEKLAMEAPVKMLFPLIAFIFPCTFIVIFFPIAMKFLHSGF